MAKALALDIPHLSLYSLILEHHTVFMNKMRRGKLNLPTEDLEAEMFEYIIREMEANGFEHYEISNFSKPDFTASIILCIGIMMNIMVVGLGHQVI